MSDHTARGEPVVTEQAEHRIRAGSVRMKALCSPPAACVTPPAECAHCGQTLPHAGTSWRESGACRRSEARAIPPTKTREGGA